MNLKEARVLARTLIKKHIPHSKVIFKYNKELELKDAMGITYTRIIDCEVAYGVELNPYFVKHNLEIHVKHTILHEIAHVLTYFIGSDHNQLWLECFQKLLKKERIEEGDLSLPPLSTHQVS